MALEGTLQDFALVDILQLIGMQQKTGILTLTRKEETINVVLKEGMVVWAAPPDEVFEANLGRVLVRRGLITRERWEEGRQLRARAGQRLIPFLSGGQWVSPRDLERVVQRQVLETLYRALRWRDGRYSFDAQGQVDLSRGQIAPVATETILLEAVRQVDEWPLIEQRLSSPDLVVQRSSRPVYHNQVPAEALTLLQLVDGQRTAREVAELCDLGEFEAYKAITDLLAAGAVQLERGGVQEAAEEFRPVRPLWRPPSWLFQIMAGAVTLALLLLRFSSADDPLHLFSAHPLSGEGEIQTRRVSIAGREISRALDQYLLLHRVYPKDLTQLQAEGLLKGELRDPWGRSWVYEPQASTYRLMTPGPDGRLGTADDRDLSPAQRPD
jgi:hypothetical protein